LTVKLLRQHATISWQIYSIEHHREVTEKS